jgi:hypothetical protein
MAERGQIAEIFALGSRERGTCSRGAYNEELKALFLRIAAQYRDLALQIDDDPVQWRAKLIESRRAKQE